MLQKIWKILLAAVSLANAGEAAAEPDEIEALNAYRTKERQLFCQWERAYLRIFPKRAMSGKQILFFLFFLSTILLLLENVLFKAGIEGSEACISLEQFKWIMFFALESSTFSALVEAIVNIPEETLPSRQQKTGSVKLGTNIDTNCND